MVPAKKPVKLNLKRFRLRTTSLALVIQIIAVVGLVGYFSDRNGRQAVEDLAERLSDEVAGRIEENANRYFDRPHQALRTVNDGVKSDMIDFNNFEQLQSYFWQLVRANDFESYHSYGNEEGEFVGVEYCQDLSYPFFSRRDSDAALRMSAIRPTRKLNKQSLKMYDVLLISKKYLMILPY